MDRLDSLDVTEILDSLEVKDNDLPEVIYVLDSLDVKVK
jgi:hypothetical protein